MLPSFLIRNFLRSQEDHFVSIEGGKEFLEALVDNVVLLKPSISSVLDEEISLLDAALEIFVSFMDNGSFEPYSEMILANKEKLITLTVERLSSLNH